MIKYYGRGEGKQQARTTNYTQKKGSRNDINDKGPSLSPGRSLFGYDTLARARVPSISTDSGDREKGSKTTITRGETHNYSRSPTHPCCSRSAVAGVSPEPRGRTDGAGWRLSVALRSRARRSSQSATRLKLATTSGRDSSPTCTVTPLHAGVTWVATFLRYVSVETLASARTDRQRLPHKI